MTGRLLLIVKVYACKDEYQLLFKALRFAYLFSCGGGIWHFNSAASQQLQ